ncbi:polysaccharide biosynthesis tyrosine autokinase [Brevibacillus sp. SYSU BS000544]|uniref:polysaccharide biosynthesis tyrosine autokinase n=1 Tax=Brevibacillus sp. SYSU BS000544 TaxID=3416443 RepID=UPI003CE4CC0D
METTIIDIRVTMRVFRRQLPFILLVTLGITLLSAVLTIFVIPPVYQAKAEILVSDHENTSRATPFVTGDIDTNLKLIETYLVIFTSPRILELVANKVGEPEMEELKKKIKVKPVVNSQVISITVEDTSQENAVRIANTLASTFKEEIITLMSLHNVQILTEAKVNAFPVIVRPKPVLTTIVAFIMGLLLSIGLAFLRHHLDSKLRIEEKIEEKCGLPVLGSVPKLRSYRWSKLTNASISEKSAIFTEAFRHIRTNLLLAHDQDTVKTILITSPQAREGKSFAAVHLAISLAQIKKKTIYIDANFRNPVGHEFFGISNDKGLSSYLSQQISPEEIIHPTTFHHLQVIPSGPLTTSSSELLYYETMKSLLEHLKQQYDIILFDGPPILPFAEPKELASLSDGSVIVVEANKTSSDQLVQALAQLKKINAASWGIVLNKTAKNAN